MSKIADVGFQRKIKNPYPRDKLNSDNKDVTFTVLASHLKVPDKDCRKKAVVHLGKIHNTWALDLLLSICIYDKNEGVRVVTISSIIEHARKSPKAMIRVQKRALHPIFNSWQYYPTVRYLRAVHWALSVFVYRRNDAENIIRIITRKRITVMEAEIAKEMDAIIETVKSHTVNKA